MTLVFPLPGAPLNTIFFGLRIPVRYLCQKYTEMSSTSQDEFYKSLKEKLESETSWPSIYLFKFIVKSDSQALDAVVAVFENEKERIQLKPSKAGTYTSVSVKTLMLSPDAVIEKYRRVGEIEGVISL
jgi:putative lipoic acid-binding regulatory protein